VIRRIVYLQHEISCTIVPVSFPLYPHVKSTELGFIREFLLVSESASKRFHTIHRLSSIDSAMASSAPESRASTPTIGTEDGSITHAPASVNGKRRTTPFDTLRSNESMSDESIIEEFVGYNERMGRRPHCIHRVQAANGTAEKKCQCLHALGESVFCCEAVAQYQVYFGRKKRVDQQRMVIQSIQSSLLFYDSSYANKYGSTMFPIPFLLSEDDCMPLAHYKSLREAKICRDSLMDLLGIGKLYWKTCLHHAINNTIPEYKLKGKKTNWKRRWDEMYYDSLVEHFEELRKEAGPIATRFVREKTGETTTRDDNEKVEALPPSFSKRQCYYNYCHS
jgi:hypothetical protein